MLSRRSLLSWIFCALGPLDNVREQWTFEFSIHFYKFIDISQTVSFKYLYNQSFLNKTAA